MVGRRALRRGRARRRAARLARHHRVPRRAGAVAGACRERAPGSAARDRPAPRRRRAPDRNPRRRHRLARDGAPLPGARLARLAPAAAARGADLHHRLRLCRSVRRRRSGAGGVAAGDGVALADRVLVSGDPLAPRLHPRDGGRALPLRLCGGADDVRDPERIDGRGRAHARRRALRDVSHRRPAAGAAGARDRARAGAAGGAERHRRERISRRQDAHRLGLHHLAQPRQPRRRGADRLPHAGDRRRAHRARAARTPRPALRRLDQAFAHGRADTAAARRRDRRGARLRAPGRRRLRPSGRLPSQGDGPARARQPARRRLRSGISRGRSASRSRRRSERSFSVSW